MPASHDKSEGCCPEPPCPTVTLLCDSISASKAKCGMQVFKKTGGTSCYTNPSASPCECHTEFDPPSSTYAGSVVPCIGYYLKLHQIRTSTCTFDYYQTTFTVDDVGSCTRSDPTPPTCAMSFGPDRSIYEDEYTTADLETHALNELDTLSFPNTFSGNCSAVRDLSGSEATFTIRRIKYKFRVTASVTCRLKVLWNETFKPRLSAVVTYCGTSYPIGTPDPDPAHWTTTAKTYTFSFSGNPCGPNNPGGAPTHPTGLITEFDSSVFDLNEPASDGAINITDVRWSILDGNNDTDSYNPSPSSIQGVDGFAGSGTSYLCNSRTAAQPNCIPPAP